MKLSCFTVYYIDKWKKLKSFSYDIGDKMKSLKYLIICLFLTSSFFSFKLFAIEEIKVDIKKTQLFLFRKITRLYTIEELNELKTLNFYVKAVKLNDEEIKYLLPLEKLETLNLGGSDLSDASFVVFRQMKSLKSLFLHDTQIKGEGLFLLRDHPNIEELDLSGTELTSKNLEELGRMKKLKKLWLDNNIEIDDDAINYLLTLESLEHLTLDDTFVGDKGILKLAKLKNLKFLSIYRARTSKVGREKLKELLPNLEIIYYE